MLSTNNAGSTTEFCSRMAFASLSLISLPRKSGSSAHISSYLLSASIKCDSSTWARDVDILSAATQNKLDARSQVSTRTGRPPVHSSTGEGRKSQVSWIFMKLDVCNYLWLLFPNTAPAHNNACSENCGGGGGGSSDSCNNITCMMIRAFILQAETLSPSWSVLYVQGLW